MIEFKIDWLAFAVHGYGMTGHGIEAEKAFIWDAFFSEYLGAPVEQGKGFRNYGDYRKTLAGADIIQAGQNTRKVNSRKRTLKT